MPIVKDAVAHFRDHHMTDHAAALTYYSLLSLFPALLVGVVLLGLLGEQKTVNDVARYLTDHGAPKETVDLVRSSLDTAIASRGSAKTPLLVLGLGIALYGASGLFGAVGRALNVVLETDDDRGFVHRKLNDLGSTLLSIGLVVLAVVMIFLGGGLARDLFEEIGLGSTAASVWNVLRWPGAVGVVMFLYAFIYYAAPDTGDRHFRWVSPGAVAGVLLWIVASAGFGVYVSHFGSYNATYGAFAAVVILLIWLWLTNVALLLGAELNRAIERARAA